MPISASIIKTSKPAALAKPVKKSVVSIRTQPYQSKLLYAGTVELDHAKVVAPNEPPEAPTYKDKLQIFNLTKMLFYRFNVSVDDAKCMDIFQR